MPTNVPTPHISAEYGSIAKTVLMPGDPLRSKYIAENFLKDPVLVNNVRGVQGYTGKWKDTEVTVMASGMGIPSIGIYSWELYNFYDCLLYTSKGKKPTTMMLISVLIALVGAIIGIW